MMKILLTGATGFLGSHLLKALLKENYEIIILKRSFSNIRRIKDLLGMVKVYDIDQCELKQVFEEQGHIHAVMHTATCYGRNKESISQIYETNTRFSLNLLETAIGYNTNIFFNTDTALDSNLNSYALSKKQFVEWGKKFSKENQISFINLKLEHIYGPDDDETKFVTYIMNQCRRNVIELNLTKGEQQRDFIYIDNVVNVYMLLLKQNWKEKNGFNQYEIGTGETIAIRDLVIMIHELTKSKTKLNFGAIPYRENEIMMSKSKNKQLKEISQMYMIPLKIGLNQMLN